MSLGKSRSRSSPSSVWQPQGDVLQDIYRQGSNLLNSTPSGEGLDYARNIVGQSLPAVQNLLTGGRSADLLNDPNLTGIASGDVQNQYLGGAIQAGLGDITRNLTRNILPGIRGGAVASNTTGGSRQGIAEGLAISDANRQAGDFVNRMLSDNFGQMMNQRLQALGLQGSAAGAADDLTSRGASMLPEMLNLGFAPEQAYWQNRFNPLMTYAQLVGRPTVLGGGSSGSGWNVGMPTRSSD